LVSSAATERATISLVPPGANGTTKRIALLGHGAFWDWAQAGPVQRQSADKPALSAQRRELLFMNISSLFKKYLKMPDASDRQNLYSCA
jgi:hypothetical protein